MCVFVWEGEGGRLKKSTWRNQVNLQMPQAMSRERERESEGEGEGERDRAREREKERGRNVMYYKKDPGDL